MRVRDWSIIVIASSIAALAGCGGGGATETTSTGAGGGSTGSASTGSGTGAGGASASHYGYITIAQTQSADPGQITWGGDFNADFVDHVDGMSSDDCASATVGACSTYVCYGTGMGTKLVNAGAGDITVDGLTDQNGAVTTIGPLQPNVDMLYYTTFASSDQKLFAGGETITVKATGGQVPAFSLGATAPHLITVTAPDLSGEVTMNASFDFPVAWTNGKDGNVDVNLTASVQKMGKDGFGFITCTFPAASGKGVIPGAALQKLLNTPGEEVSGQIDISVSSHAAMMVGEFSVDLAITSDAAEPQMLKVH